MPDRLRRIGVAFVDTPEGRAALAAGAALAARSGAALEVVTAVPAIDWTGVAPPGPAYREALALARDTAADAARAVAHELAPDVETIVRAVVDQPLAAMVAAPAGIDVLVCGSRGHGPVRSVLLGSVSRPLMHSARCPLVVVPRGAAGDVERVFDADSRLAQA